MTFDELLAALAEFDPVPEQALAYALEHWDDLAPRFRGLLHAYVDGSDVSERTEMALYSIVHLQGEKADTGSFPDLCRLGEINDKVDSIFGPDAIALSYLSILCSTFDGDPRPLLRLIDCETASDDTRCEALLVLAYLTCTNQCPERVAYDYLSALPARLDQDAAAQIWFGFAKTVAALGFAGLAGAAEGAFDRAQIDDLIYTKAEFWRELRESQASGRELADPDWDRFRPFGSAVGHLSDLMSDSGLDGPAFEAEPFIQEPIRNPLRTVGRNDPCPCGSGKKYKKCCLQAGPA